MYGKELIIDLYDCDASMFTRFRIEQFMIDLCELLDMKRGPLHFWDYEDCPDEKENAPDHLCGTSAIQFIYTSNITIHTLDRVGEVYINIFSCKEFDENEAYYFVRKFFRSGRLHVSDDISVLTRGDESKCSQ